MHLVVLLPLDLVVLIWNSSYFVISAHAVQAYEGKATPGQLAKNWLVSYAGNFLGSALVVALVAASGVMASAKAPAAVAVAKTSLTFTQVGAYAVLSFFFSFGRCLGTVKSQDWMALSSQEAVRCANEVTHDSGRLVRQGIIACLYLCHEPTTPRA